jgi:hypothetical protein
MATDTTLRTWHRRWQNCSADMNCSRVGCPHDTKLGAFAWSVRGDINYEALCDTCHDREFAAIHYAICSQDR